MKPQRTQWSVLADRFFDITCLAGGPLKRIDGSLCIVINNGKYDVVLGCYSIADWPRHVDIGPFDSEEEALEATENKIEEAKVIVQKEIDDENGGLND